MCVGRWLCIGGCGLGREVVPPLGMVLGVFPCSIHPQVASPTKMGESFGPTPPANHTAYAVECPTRTKKQPARRNPKLQWNLGTLQGVSGVKTGIRGLKVV